MKRVLSLVLVLMLVLGTIMPAFAEVANTVAVSTETQELADMGVIAGDGTGFNEEGALRRSEFAVILSQLYGMKATAQAYELPASFTDLAEGAWYVPYIAYAESQGWMSGMGDGTFAPDAFMTAQQVNAMYLKVLGYEVAWDAVNATAVEAGVAVDAADASLVLRGEAFMALRTTLDVTPVNGTAALGTTLPLVGYVAPVVEPVAPATVEIVSAKALNDVVVEIELDDDLDAPVAVATDMFEVVSDDTALEVASVMFAPWDEDNYTVLVTLADTMAAGTLYSVASGETTENFGGIDEDDTEPTVIDVMSADYNEVTIEFSEAVLIDGLTVELEEKYGDQDELTVVSWSYDSSTEITVITSEQAAATLYTSAIDGAVDLAGNSMEDEDDSNSFTGTEMNDSEQSVNDADADDYLTITVKFDVKVDEATALVASNYSINEKYNGQDEVVVESVVLVDDDDCDAGFEGATVELTLATGLEANTLYELEVANVGTLYGEDYDADADAVSFTGLAMDSDEPTGITVVAVSNTQITITINDDSDAADEYDLSMFTVTEKYGDQDELVLIDIDDIDDNVITINTEAQSTATLYEMEVAEGLADKWGNVTTDELTDTFTGKGVASEIEDITVAIDDDGVELTVTFDQNYGDGALDVANYNIDGGIGYPTKVEEGDEDNEVVLTIKETSLGELYELTVTNIFNADDVAMDEDGLTATFVGTGDTVDAPRLEAAVALDEQTIKLYFDTDVDDINAIDTAAEVLAMITIMGDVEVSTTNAIVEKDVNTDLVYVITLTGAADSNVTLADADDENLYTITFHEDAGLDSDYTEVELAPNDDEATMIEISGLVSLDDSTVKVYFNQTVRTVADGAITIDHDYDALTAKVNFINGYSVNDAETEWIFGLATAMDSTEELDVLVAVPANINISGTSTNIAFDADELELTMAGNADEADEIDDIAAVMTNEKSMVVYFPVDMNEAQAETVTNYSINSVNPILVEYDDDDYTATLTFVAAITVNTYDLVLEDTLTNKALTNNVEDALEVQFAVNTDDADMVLVEEVTVSGQVMTIELNQLAMAGADVTTANVLNLFDITINGTVATTASAISAVVVSTTEGGIDVDASATNFQFIEITFNAATLTLNGYGEVAFDDPATVVLTGINAETADVEADPVVFVQE